MLWLHQHLLPPASVQACRDTRLHEAVAVVEEGGSGAQNAQQVACIVHREQRVLIALEQRQRHAEDHLGALIQERVPRPHHRLRLLQTLSSCPSGWSWGIRCGGIIVHCAPVLTSIIDFAGPSRQQ